MIPTLTSLRVEDHILYTSKSSFDERNSLNKPVRWYEAKVVGFYEGDPVLCTVTKNCHIRPMNQFYYRPYSSNLVTQPNTVIIQGKDNV